jgi:transcriptional antiterminator RfaH
MPLLPPQPDWYPSDLFESDFQGADPDRAWRVLHTQPRQEKSLARQLYQARVPFYLPTVAKRCLVRKRILHSYVPLFPGYVFLLGTAEERVIALTTNRVVRVLEILDQEEIQQDLVQIYRLINTGAALRPEDRLAPGVPVRIVSGPLAGLSGTILRTASGARFVVQVNFIQRGASVLLDDCCLAAASEEPSLSS